MRQAAPDEFLRLIEEDLAKPEPAVFQILKPVDSDFLGSGCPRTGLLWALEGLAWSPQTLPRVVKILAKLSTREIGDNWANKPLSRLEAIFRSWMPQTAAPLEKRRGEDGGGTLSTHAAPSPHRRARQRALEDEIGGRCVRVRGHAKVMCRLMLGILALTVDQSMRLLGS